MQLTFVGKKDLQTHIFYDESVKLAKNLKVHNSEKYPNELMNLARPNEEQKYKTYREQAFKSPTTTYYDKVLGIIKSGQSAEDWSINYPGQPTTSARDEDSLKTYTTKNYKNFDSFENWFFSFGIDKVLSDPNGVIAVYSEPTKNDTELYNPFTYIYESQSVITFIDGEYAELLSEEKSIVNSGNKQIKEGRIFYVFDRNTVAKYAQAGEREKYNYVELWSINHNIGYLPVFKLGGFVKEYKEDELLYKSFISGVVDSWDEGVRRYSDHQVNMVLNLHPKEWEIADSPCPTCSGKGTKSTRTFSGLIDTTCEACNGGGSVSTNTPFGKKIIKVAQKIGASESITVPTPPGGFIQRDIESISFLKEEYKDKIREGLAGVHMEFLMEEPKENSGVAKIVDREPLYKFLGVVYRHLVENIIHPSYYFISAWRYGQTDSKFIDYLPTVAIPSKFNLITAQEITDQIKAVKDAGFNPLLINNLQYKFAQKEFGDASDEAKIIKLMSIADPLPGLSQEDKMVILSNGGITKDDYIFSSQLPNLINKAKVFDEKFLQLDLKKQIETLKGLISGI